MINYLKMAESISLGKPATDGVRADAGVGGGVGYKNQIS